MRRVIAALIDGLAVAIVLIVMLLFSFESVPKPLGIASEELCEAAFGSKSGCIGVIGDKVWSVDAGLLSPTVLDPMLFSLANGIFLKAFAGISIGKAVVGLRVVRRVDGGLPGVKSAFLRTVPLLIFFQPFSYLIPILEFGLVLSTKGHRRLGDRFGQTLVVDRGDAGFPLVVPGLETKLCVA